MNEKPIEVSLKVSVDELSFIIGQLEAPVRPVVDLIARLKTDAVEQLNALKNEALKSAGTDEAPTQENFPVEAKPEGKDEGQ